MSGGIPLTVAGGGMTRLRVKGAALKNSLYQLTNGYVTAAQTVKVRPGTFRNVDLGPTTGAGTTKGLVAFQGSKHVFASSVVDVPDGYTLHVLSSPAGNYLVPSLDTFTVTPGVQSAFVGSNTQAGDVTSMRGFSDATINSSGHAGSVSPTTVASKTIHGIFYTTPTSTDDPSFLYIVVASGWAPADGATLTYPVQGGGTNTLTLNSAAATAGDALETGLVAYGWSVASLLPDFSGATATISITGAGTPEVAPVPLKDIHFAAPFMGFLYVVAEFTTDGGSGVGTVFHYWIQTSGVWAADTVYQIGQVVSPSVPNGLNFQATRISTPNPVWTPSTLEAVDNIVEPTVPNGYYFTATATDGANPITGTVEPTWPTATGATVDEDSETTGAGVVATAAPQPSATQPAPGAPPKYNNPYSGGELI